MLNALSTSCRGVSLLETLIAALLIATAIAGLAPLIALASQQSANVRRHALALAQAQGQLESLRALTWGFAADGTRTSDARLSPSPPGALLTEVEGYSDRLPGGSSRRWAISPLDPADPDTLVIEVCIFGHTDAVVSATAADACVSTLRVRRP